MFIITIIINNNNNPPRVVKPEAERSVPKYHRCHRPNRCLKSLEAQQCAPQAQWMLQWKAAWSKVCDHMWPLLQNQMKSIWNPIEWGSEYGYQTTNAPVCDAKMLIACLFHCDHWISFCAGVVEQHSNILAKTVWGNASRVQPVSLLNLDATWCSNFDLDMFAVSCCCVILSVLCQARTTSTHKLSQTTVKSFFLRSFWEWFPFTCKSLVLRLSLRQAFEISRQKWETRHPSSCALRRDSNPSPGKDSMLHPAKIYSKKLCSLSGAFWMISKVKRSNTAACPRLFSSCFSEGVHRFDPCGTRRTFMCDNQRCNTRKACGEHHSLWRITAWLSLANRFVHFLLWRAKAFNLCKSVIVTR